MARVLIVDDEASIRDALTIALTESGHDARAVGTAAEASQVLEGARKHPFDVLLLDLNLPDRHGLQVLSELQANASTMPVIIISADTEMSSTVRAMRDGAFDYLPKPIDLEVLERLIERAARRAAQPAPPASRPEPERDDSGPTLTGNSIAMREVWKTLGLLAASRATVLIRGESGTGKELAARALHTFSRASTAPFVAVNCAALPGPLVEAELFGFKHGAFTGADRDRAGKLESAGEGTLFLDEVGEVPLETQVKLLRVLQERKFERLGEPQSRPFRARVVAATHRDLEAMVRSGKFREDLYFRLNVATVTLPPLRERREDIPVLIEHLIGQIAREIGRPLKGVAARALDRLLVHDWPGNVRELRNVLTRAAVKTRGHVILGEEIELGRIEAPPSNGNGNGHLEHTSGLLDGAFPTLEEVEREHIRRALARTKGHRGKTCDLLGISRPTLARKIRQYALKIGSGGRNGEGRDEPVRA